MSEQAPHRVDVAEFLSWDARQDGRHELIDGSPRAMTGARTGHNRILVNVLVGLRAGLRASGSPCDVFTADIAVIVPSGNVRRPDVTIGCPPFDERGTSVDQPRLVVEVLSDSTQSVDQLVKLDEYRAIAGLNYVLMIAPTTCEAALWSRSIDQTWRHEVLREPTASVELPELGLSLSLHEIYDRVQLTETAGPRLVWPGPA